MKSKKQVHAKISNHVAIHNLIETQFQPIRPSSRSQDPHVLSRQRDELRIRIQHLLHLLHESEQTISEQAKEIQVLKHTILAPPSSSFNYENTSVSMDAASYANYIIHEPIIESMKSEISVYKNTVAQLDECVKKLTIENTQLLNTKSEQCLIISELESKNLYLSKQLQAQNNQQSHYPVLEIKKKLDPEESFIDLNNQNNHYENEIHSSTPNNDKVIFKSDSKSLIFEHGQNDQSLKWMDVSPLTKYKSLENGSISVIPPKKSSIANISGLFPQDDIAKRISDLENEIKGKSLITESSSAQDDIAKRISDLENEIKGKSLITESSSGTIIPFFKDKSLHDQISNNEFNSFSQEKNLVFNENIQQIENTSQPWTKSTNDLKLSTGTTDTASISIISNIISESNAFNDEGSILDSRNDKIMKNNIASSFIETPPITKPNDLNIEPSIIDAYKDVNTTETNIIQNNIESLNNESAELSVINVANQDTIYNDFEIRPKITDSPITDEYFEMTNAENGITVQDNLKTVTMFASVANKSPENEKIVNVSDVPKVTTKPRRASLLPPPRSISINSTRRRSILESSPINANFSKSITESGLLEDVSFIIESASENNYSRHVSARNSARFTPEVIEEADDDSNFDLESSNDQKLNFMGYSDNGKALADSKVITPGSLETASQKSLLKRKASLIPPPMNLTPRSILLNPQSNRPISESFTKPMGIAASSNNVLELSNEANKKNSSTKDINSQETSNQIHGGVNDKSGSNIDSLKFKPRKISILNIISTPQSKLMPRISSNLLGNEDSERSNSNSILPSSQSNQNDIPQKNKSRKMSLMVPPKAPTMTSRKIALMQTPTNTTPKANFAALDEDESLVGSLLNGTIIANDFTLNTNMDGAEYQSLLYEIREESQEPKKETKSANYILEKKSITDVPLLSEIYPSSTLQEIFKKQGSSIDHI